MSPQRAYRMVRTALKQGALTRPGQCERCGATPPLGSDGRSTIHAHHADYSRPLDVEWICAACHRAETRLPDKMGAPTFGERNGAARLNAEAVAHIRSSTLSTRQLADYYGVSWPTVGNVRKGKTWTAAINPESKDNE